MSPFITGIPLQPVARTLNDIFTSLDELLLFTGKKAPPHDLWGLTMRIRREAMESAPHIGEREHTVFPLNILHDTPPMRMIVELCA